MIILSSLLGLIAIVVIVVSLKALCSANLEAERSEQVHRARERELLRIQARGAEANYKLDAAAFAARQAMLQVAKDQGREPRSR